MTGLAPGWSEAQLARIEDATLNASAPPQQLWLDGWLVRLCPGKAKRSRSINAVAAGREALPAKLDRAEALYREAGLPMIVRITPFSAPATLDQDLDRLGFLAFDHSRVMVVAIGAGSEPAVPAAAADLTLQAVDAATFAEAVGTARGTTAAQRVAHTARLRASPVLYEGFLAQRGGELVACGQVAIGDGHAGLYDILTVPKARGQGLSTWLCARLLQHAGARGARSAYLQVDAANAAARRVYQRLGFVDGYAYHYRSRDPAAA